MFNVKYRFMMQAEIYNTLSAQKVIHEAAVRSGISEGALSAAWDAIGQVVKVWATEGHSIAIPGLGRMRFGVRATPSDLLAIGGDQGRAEGDRHQHHLLRPRRQDSEARDQYRSRQRGGS